MCRRSEYCPTADEHIRKFPTWMAYVYFILGFFSFGGFWAIWLIHYAIHKCFYGPGNLARRHRNAVRRARMTPTDDEDDD